MPPRRHPTKLKVMRGSYRPDKHGAVEDEPVGEPLTGIPPHPETLGEKGRSKWNETIQRLIDLGLSEDGYLDSVEMYCLAWDEVAECTRDIKKRGDILTSLKTKDTKQNPSVNRRFKAMDNIRRYIVEFGFTPSSRGNVTATTKAGGGVKSRKRQA